MTADVTKTIPMIDELAGLWRRSLIAWPDGPRDTATWVNWMQGPRVYLDLRQPAVKPDFHEVHGLRQLDRLQVAWMAEQEGFAGALHFDGTYFEWRREIDFQPQAIYSDEGKLWYDGDKMIEEGRDIAYIEHWHREPIEIEPICAMRLKGRADGVRGFLLRAGSLFMYARGRNAEMPAGKHLRELVVAAPNLQAAQDLVDCEISQGAITSAGWIIQRSSLPFREAEDIAPEYLVHAGGDDPHGMLVTRDTTPDGRRMLHHWDILDVEGDADAIPQPQNMRVAR
ncbi:MAG: hypothetical protein Q7S99_02065 [Parvibaculum sp.]|nr:hypothetical protein [Parvibaculum sp.]